MIALRLATLAASVLVAAACAPGSLSSSRGDAAATSGGDRSAEAAADAQRPGTLSWVQVAVRQGDAALFRGPCGDLGVLDTNRFRSAEVLAVLDGLGSRQLAWVAATHYDADHLGGLVDVVSAPGASAQTAYDRGGERAEKDTATYRTWFDWATSEATTRQPVDIGDTFSLCSGDHEVVFEVVSAGTDGTAAAGVAVTEENDKGLCLKITYLEFDGATCGDVNGTDDGSRTDVETAVAPVLGDVDFAKINHHGSAFSSNFGYVGTLKAQASVVSTGANGFGHPDPDVLARWDAHGDVYRTLDRSNAFVDGDVTVTTTGRSFFTVATSASKIRRSYSLDVSARCPGFADAAGNHLIGTGAGDIIYGTDGPDVICGLGGADVMVGGKGADLLIGGAGADRLAGGSGRDELLGQRGNDVLLGQDSDDALSGGADPDRLNGGAGRDLCRGGAGRDSLRSCER